MLTTRKIILISALTMGTSPTPSAVAADVVVNPAAGSAFVIKDASGATDRLRVNENGQVTIPILSAGAQQATPVCSGTGGVLGPCAATSGGSYSAGTGLTLSSTTFSVAPAYQLPQACGASQVPQWNGTAWICATIGAAALPVGTVNQTLRYDSTNALVANNLLQAFADGGFVAGGTYGTGSIPATGSGARMMWYPAKAAFRAGVTAGTLWDDANVGTSSTAMGNDTIASGFGSTAIGAAAHATNTYSVAMGGNTTASGYASTAMGYTTTASGADSTAMGNGTIASGDFSTALGFTTTADGDYSIAIGSNASSNGHQHAFAYGDGSAVTGNDRDKQFRVLATGGIVLVGDAGKKIQIGGFVTGQAAAIYGGPLAVYDGVNTDTTYAYFVNTSGSSPAPYTGECNPCTTQPILIDASNGAILAKEFDALSDARIKDIVGISDSSHDLAALNAIEITDYAMKDKVRDGDRRYKKVVAQQVEKVFPQIVSKHTDFIPNVYAVANVVESPSGSYRLQFDKPHGISNSARRLRLLPEGGKTMEAVDIVAVPSARDVVISASGWTAQRAFVYGEQADDVLAVDYEGLASLNVSATQELSKRLDTAHALESRLDGRIDEKDREIAALRAEIAEQKVRVAALESLAGDLAEVKAQLAAIRRSEAKADIAMRP